MKLVEPNPSVAVAEPFRAIEPVSSVRDISLLRSYERHEPSFEELFGRLWSNFDLLTRPKAERLESLTVDVPLSARQALAGGTVRILVPEWITCPKCGGRGHAGFYECWTCQGHGGLAVEHPVRLDYPAGVLQTYEVRVPLDTIGIHNFYLTVRFRRTDSA